jgi:hypothetical protein
LFKFENWDGVLQDSYLWEMLNFKI